MKRLAYASVLLGLWLLTATPTKAATLPMQYPRLANYYLTRSLGATEINELARWDIVILGLDNQYNNPGAFAQLRAKNPDIIILAYVLSEEYPGGYESMTDPNQPLVKLRSGLADGWWLRTASGEKTGFWPGAKMLNVTNQAPVVNGQRWNTYLANFMHDQVMSTGLWDGIFYDNVFNDVSWVNRGNIDLNRDGVADNAATADAAWREGMTSLLATSRRLEGNDKIIIGNGGGQYYPDLNGRLIESFPSDLDGGWSGAMGKYNDVMNRGLYPAVVIVNGASSTGAPTDYRTMRYVLASTLMGNGFFSFDEGQVKHSALWKYDEFEAYLGLPTASAKRVWPSASKTFELGVWRRDYANGMVLVNSTDRPRTIQLGDGYEELRGIQSSVNGGRVVTQITLAGHDGRILLKRQAVIDNASYVNGALVRIYKPDGSLTRNAFFSYNASQPGGQNILQKDLDNDGHVETVSGANGRVTVTNYRNQAIARWQPFRSYTGNLNITTADINQDGVVDLVVAPQGGKNQRVIGFTMTGRRLFNAFRPYRYDYAGGVSVAAGDVNGDGRIEIVTGAGVKADPRVSVFAISGQRLSSWLAYKKTMRGSVRVAVGDLNNDGVAEIVVVPGSNAAPHVKILNLSGRTALPAFYALAKSYRQGLFVSVDDVDHNSQNRIIISTPIVY